MKRFLYCLGLLIAAAFSAQAQVAVQASANHEQLLASPDARIAANKRLVYDFWREVFEAGHMELADKYMAESYIVFRIEGGKIAEHWDAAPKQVAP